MRDSARIYLAALVICGFSFLARADYESQVWAVGQYPHRIGIIGVNNDETRIFWGHESWPERSLIVPVHPYTFLAMVNVPIIGLVITFLLRRRYRSRHANAPTSRA
jgi:hypothetical protein